MPLRTREKSDGSAHAREVRVREMALRTTESNDLVTRPACTLQVIGPRGSVIGGLETIRAGSQASRFALARLQSTLVEGSKNPTRT